LILEEGMKMFGPRRYVIIAEEEIGYATAKNTANCIIKLFFDPNNFSKEARKHKIYN